MQQAIAIRNLFRGSIQFRTEKPVYFKKRPEFSTKLFNRAQVFENIICEVGLKLRSTPGVLFLDAVIRQRK